LTLVRNDLHLHGIALGATVIAVVVLLYAVKALEPSGSDPSAVGLILNLNLVMVLVWGEWLVSREKTKGTIGWLRTLPVPSGALVMSKIATYMLACVVLWTASTILFVPHYFFPRAWLLWLALQSMLIFAGTLSVCGRFRFRQKVGQLLPLVVIGVPLVGLLALRRVVPDAVAHLQVVLLGGAGLAAISVGLLASSAGVVAITSAWVRNAETFELTE
jgi:hypothetical protein